MASVSLHESDSTGYEPTPNCGSHTDGSGGYVNIIWGGVQVSFHADKLPRLRERLSQCVTCVDELIAKAEGGKDNGAA